MTAESYDTIVIGAGQAGPFLAAKLVSQGRKVALVESRDLGGTCVNRAARRPRRCASRHAWLTWRGARPSSASTWARSKWISPRP
ncbi:NAD(P)-binding protein [Klebsiella quasipneumoniae]|uniref:NAD(P)-binding protein n=1 Tax=Klebsiella quasipneumoniae TaxID=1463165 RepID=UPI001D12CDB8|nr:NAD(P)-binding protein [Klebsiella quasipneumoniae]